MARFVDLAADESFQDPGVVAVELINNYQEGVLLSNFLATMTRIVLGFVLAMGAGIAFGTLMGLSRTAEEFFDLWIMVGITIPSLAILLILYILFGLNEFATVLAIGMSAFPAIAINVWQGVKSVDNKLLAMGRVYGVNKIASVHPDRLSADRSLPRGVVTVRTGHHLENHRRR